MWFGTRENMQWVKDPQAGMSASKVGWAAETQLLGGGKYVRSSRAAHREYEMQWGLAPRAEIQTIVDYADGIYGEGKIYWVDPFAMDRNLFSTDWAAPFQGASGGTILSGGERLPTIVPTTPNVWGYPTQSALYTVTPADRKPEFWLPIPPGYDLLLGAHGQAGTGGTVAVSVDGAPSTNLTLLPVTGEARFNRRIAGASGVTVTLGGNGSITLSALQAVLVATGAPLPKGRYMSGMGNAGCRFAEQPKVEAYSAVMDLVGLSARLVEAVR